MNCGACGDKLTTAGDPHDCWVWTKNKEQEVIHEICTRCGEVQENGFRHWRCWERDTSTYGLGERYGD